MKINHNQFLLDHLLGVILNGCPILSWTSTMSWLVCEG